MIQKITIDKIYFNAQSKDGKAYINKQTSQPFKWVTIYSAQNPKSAKYISGFALPDSPVNNWKVGDSVAVEITQKGDFWNFKPANENVLILLELSEKVKQLEARVGEIEDAVFMSDEEVIAPKVGKSEEQKIAEDMANMEGEDIDPSDIPF